MAKVTSRFFADALVRAGVMTADEINNTERIVIDIDGVTGFTKMYIVRTGEDKLALALPPLLKEMMENGQAVRPGG